MRPAAIKTLTRRPKVQALGALMAAALLPWAPASMEAAPTPWWNGLNHNDLEVVQRVLRSDIDVDIASDRGKTALMAAAARGRADLVHALLNAGADPNARNRNGGTPLMYAVMGRRAEAVETLLAAGAAVNDRSSNGWSALMIATAKGFPQQVNQLLEAGADVNTTDIYAWTPLMRGAREGRTACVNRLLASEAVDVHRRNDRGMTALHLATAAGHPKIIQALLDAGADRNVVNRGGESPLMMARRSGDPSVLAAYR